MSTNPGKYDTRLSTNLVIASFAGLAIVFYRYKNVIFKKLFPHKLLKNQKIEIVNDHESCVKAVKKINSLFTERRILGFDCEWVTKNGSRHPVALIQLASTNGECTLIRLSKIQYVPLELKVLLEDPSVFKIGVAPSDDAKLLWNDYAVRVNGVLDLRHLAVLAQEKPEGLASLAEKHLNLKMDKHWQIRCSNWEIDTFSERQIKYAADDAHVSIELFDYFINRLLRRNIGFFHNLFRTPRWEDIKNICQNFINVRFSNKQIRTNKVDFIDLISKEQKQSLNMKSQRRSYTSCIKSKVVYENCYMKTADGETLCTCDRKKAEWYVEKELAEVICDEPFTIRLNFEPAGRSVGTVGLFYQMPRKKICVVCGPTESYIKKNVVPREYRRLFPLVMKDHSSHDVLLLCMHCHQSSNIRDQSMRSHLAQICNAPITDAGQPKIIEDPRIRKVKSAARALLVASSKHSIPEKRKLELEQEILQFFPSEKCITEDLLMTACDLDYRSENSLYESHGRIVVDYFVNSSGGLLELEKIWREHFLTSMKPKHMPEFWSVTHTKSRLEIRADEGRVNQTDLEIAGLTINNPSV